MRLNMSMSSFYFEQMHNPQMAFKLTSEAIIAAKEGMAVFAGNKSISE